MLKHPISVSYPDFLDWQRDARSFHQMAAARFAGPQPTAPGTPERISGEEISSGFLNMLGIKPILGSEFSPDEDKQGGAPSSSSAIAYGAIVSPAAAMPWANR